MSQKAEQAKTVVGKPYTPTVASALQRIVGTQTINVLKPGSVRGLKNAQTYVITDAKETVVAVLISE